ncbi:homoserine kinase [Spizellomyces punctatus DAOM BR117]|uniref:Homoserine kinase n=1 Tax=Spizellomyces punctatus (strain DAOM BR117) TaxID=645134 RepID=A0A0L0HUJ8_SPIPD|nr:homoserine kinase [Spizellomyces punctatus DAOM BR117]KND04793.1 homoserine kinase [Spizellomyces punctatus DAOM BR117]|eukprot:XP_016612832.1 homoserine kinase [Spizellomyces punctatus DAOM BR117]
MSRKITIRVPASTSNIGPGFDVLGATLSLHLTLTATLSPTLQSVSITYTGNNPHTVPLTVLDNLITRTASYIAAVHNVSLPPMDLHIDNPIPLGRGLGSSGAAVVAGVILANQACQLGLSKDRMLDFCLVIEGHPDNITASLIGGFCASYLAASVEQEHRELHELEKSGKLIPKLNGVANGSVGLPVPPIENIGRYVRLPLSKAIRAVVIIPKFELSTKLARSVLPDVYPRADVVFNLQRLAVLTSALCAEVPSPDIVYTAMQDKIHQHYRQHLVPGLPQILALTPQDLPGLLGICVSGAGPTVLALATGNFEEIGAKVQGIWTSSVGADGKPIESEVLILDVLKDGASWESVDL